LVKAISNLPEHLLEALLLPVHDELVLEVPEAEAERYKADLEAVMIQAADQVLRGIVPVEVEGKIAKRWAK
jgi:DNA polymerase-1